MHDMVHGVTSVMASISLQSPSLFDFKTPDEWPCWKQRFEQFRLASDLADESDDRQVSTLLYCMGKKQRTSSPPPTSLKQIGENTVQSSSSTMTFFRLRRTSSSKGQDLNVTAKSA